MSKTPVGGTNGLIDRFLMVMGWKATAVTNDQERKDALFWIDLAEKFVCASDALLYLNREWPLTLNAAASLVIVPNSVTTPPALDYGKDFVIEDGNGFPLKYCALDEFAALLGPTTDAMTTGPAGYMVIIDSADEVMKFRFKPAQGIASQALTLRGQRSVPDLTDVNTSFSMLPDPHDLVLLLPIAEQAAKQRKHEIDAGMLDQQTQARLDAFYGKYRANKRTTATDDNLERRASEDNAGVK